jgi:hypothetical protein
MKHDRIVTITSLVTILLITLHLAGDIARGDHSPSRRPFYAPLTWPLPDGDIRQTN